MKTTSDCDKPVPQSPHRLTNLGILADLGEVDRLRDEVVPEPDEVEVGRHQQQGVAHLAVPELRQHLLQEELEPLVRLRYQTGRPEPLERLRERGDVEISIRRRREWRMYKLSPGRTTGRLAR